ncbi:MAG TPA: hypothetical protein VKZ98_05605 [Aquaticitalea sp.]|nr:hypothetical protein [Aquaticitalea sp.]
MDTDKKHRGYTEDSKLNPSDDSLEGRWSNIQSDYRKKYPQLIEDDIIYGKNKFHEMIDRIARRTDRSRAQVENEIRGWTND